MAFPSVIRTVEKPAKMEWKSFPRQPTLVCLTKNSCNFGKGGLIPSNKYVTWLSPEKKKNLEDLDISVGPQTRTSIKRWSTPPNLTFQNSNTWIEIHFPNHHFWYSSWISRDFIPFFLTGFADFRWWSNFCPLKKAIWSHSLSWKGEWLEDELWMLSELVDDNKKSVEQNRPKTQVL